ncbi:DegT/DnrJ/EryC1/StrS family aminotransferase [Sulfurimonas xiamenensis]|uniref:DegT/DnrJ/EryC1/StrS family aminotransferase n=1 Tax=Sulfurimonas xiamenensis TaxID=2590021 RepID=A0AAJ4A3I6_9BACT|nr:DegT/DnrJ/EryC1/StrS family aminotransferase [Sulfurimonas xiamenensis]QFR43123.1 DegT/DnrJ/EryC1/StrS family aminotransferase [Sulfurimonas xiamenensis]
MKINFIDLQAQYKEYKKEIDSEVLEVMSLAQFIGGEKLNLFEKNLAAYTGSKHAIGCSSGTDALLLSLMALDISAGDEVITSPFTFISTAEVIALLGAKPVFVDIDEESYNIDPSKIEDAITERTKAIMPVSLYGQCADMEAINDIAKKHNLSVIEDACQSFGATYNNKKSCNLSTIGCTSFFPSKPLGAYGDGGAIFTNDDALAEKMRMLLNHGQNERYKHKYIGINGRLDAIQAAVLNVKLKHFDKEVRLRDEIGSRYSDLLEDSDVITPKIAPNATSVYAQYSIRVKDREAMIEKLNKKEIPTAVHYPVPLHMQEAFKYLDYKEGDFPISELVSKQIMSLPMSAYLSEAEQDFVVQAIKG